MKRQVRDVGPAPQLDGPVAYLTGEYPRASHTFILREVTALRNLGVAVETCSVRPPTARDIVGPEEAAAQDETFYVLASAKRPFRLLSDHVAAFLRGPGAWFGALALSIRTARPGLKGAVRQAFYFLEAGVLARHLSKAGAVHLHNHFADSSATLAMVAARMAGLPFSFTLHGPAELFDPVGWHLDEKVARARFTLCISHYARAQAMLFSDRAHWARIHVVHCGVEPARYATEPPPEREGLHLLFVGRLTAIKGVFVLLDALAQAGVPRLGLTLIGDGEERAALEARAAELGLDATFLGLASQGAVAEALAEADALVLPSFAEGVPVVLMEAMASARPVICTQVGGVSELVADGETGLIVPPGSAEALAGAIGTLADMPRAARAEMGARGRATVEAEFDVDREASRIAALLAGTGGDTVRVL